MVPLRPDEALAEAITRCATTGDDYVILNPDREIAWEITSDTKVDDDDLVFPVIVHMRGGSLNDIALLAAREEV